ncbi:MAG: hypothetical protein WCG03_10300 [Kiritimatiellales bacterium]
MDNAQRENIFVSLFAPKHAGLFATFTNGGFTSSFDDARANEKSLFTEDIVAHPIEIIAEVIELLCDLFTRGCGGELFSAGDDARDLAGARFPLPFLQLIPNPYDIRYRRGHRPHPQVERFPVAASVGRGNKNRKSCEMGMRLRLRAFNG